MPETATKLPTHIRLPFPWKQGEHVAIIGDTGTGKSQLMTLLVEHRDSTIVTLTKHDPSIKWEGTKTKEAADITAARSRRWVLRPTYETQRVEIARMFEATWKQRGWALFLDETYYIARQLKLEKLLERHLTQGRSMGLTLIMGAQRPVDISRFVLSSCTHLIVFRQDGRDAKTVAEAAANPISEALSALEPHQFLWYHRASRSSFIGRLQDLDAEKGA